MVDINENDFTLGLKDSEIDEIESQGCQKIRQCIDLKANKCSDYPNADSCIRIVMDRKEFFKEGSIFGAMITLTKLRQLGQEVPLLA